MDETSPRFADLPSPGSGQPESTPPAVSPPPIPPPDPVGEPPGFVPEAPPQLRIPPSPAKSLDVQEFHSPQAPAASSAEVGRLGIGELEQLRREVIAVGALAPVLEALEEAVFIFTSGGQLLHANAEALKTVDQVGIDAAIGLTLNELLGCPEEAIHGGVSFQGLEENLPEVRRLLELLQQTSAGLQVTLTLEQSAQFFVGKFSARSRRFSVAGTVFRLLILRQKSLSKRVFKKA